jgi:hypothetical protein
MPRFLTLLSLTLFAFSTPLFAEETGGLARVLDASSTSTYDGKKIVENQVLTSIGSLKTGRGGGVKLKLVSNEVIVEIAANSEIKLAIPSSGDPFDSIELLRGKVRVRVPKPKNDEKGNGKDGKPRFLLRHRKMTMGVRGTDFLAIANDDLSETELVVFEGVVEFSDERSPKETQMVKPGHWSGAGGRFGWKIHEPVKLAAPALKYFEDLTRDIPNYVLQEVPAAKSPTPTVTAAPAR